ncbi:MAG: hypothetical protein GEU28_10885 [Dehalococcoidia bacterium]|nr:hypothetical protein [Dehalococcoidia bacterium]
MTEESEDDKSSSSFRTYRNYLVAIQLWLTDRYGVGDEIYASLSSAVQSQPGFRDLYLGSHNEWFIKERLRNAWATEVVMHLPAAFGHPDILVYANHWACVQAYYATYLAAEAYLETTPWWRLKRTHKDTLRGLAVAAEKKRLFPPPWDAMCVGGSKQFSLVNFPESFTPSDISNLSNPSRFYFWDWLEKALRTTRLGELREARKRWIRSTPKRTTKGTKYSKVPPKYREEAEKGAEPSTLFRFLYRLRIASNYADADVFVLGTESSQAAAEFNRALTTLVGSSMFVLEKLAAATLGGQTVADMGRAFLASVPPARATLGVRLPHL